MNCPCCEKKLHERPMGRQDKPERRVQVRCDRCGYSALWVILFDDAVKVVRVLRGRGNMCILGEFSRSKHG